MDFSASLESSRQMGFRPRDLGRDRLQRGAIVKAVQRAIAFELKEGHRYKLAMDRLWIWRVCDSTESARVKYAFTSHYLAVHRENAVKASAPVAGCAALCSPAYADPAGGAQPGEHRQRGATASNTKPFSRKLRQSEPKEAVGGSHV